MMKLNKSQQQHSIVNATLKAIKWIIICAFSISIIACGGKKKETNVTRESPEIVINPNINEKTDSKLADNLKQNMHPQK